MSHHTYFTLGILWVFVLLLQSNVPFGWFFSSGKIDNGKKASELPVTSDDIVAEFSMESFNSKEGLTYVEKAKRKAALPNSCWQNAYQNMFAGCSEILAGEEQRSRLAWHLSDCFQKDTGRPPFPYCDVKSSMVDCLKRLEKGPHSIYLEFYLETNTICHQLQLTELINDLWPYFTLFFYNSYSANHRGSPLTGGDIVPCRGDKMDRTDAFKRQTERLVNELKRTAESAENKLENIEEQAERLLQSSDHIHNSLSSIDVKTQELAQTSKNVIGQVNVVLEHSQSVYQQSLKIADSQLELGNRQINMNERLDEGMTMLNESANKLGEKMNNLRKEAVEIEKEVGKVGDAMFKKMDTIQNKADDIENIAETSLNRQKQLLESQSSALEVLQTVTTFQSQALEESRGTLQQLIELGHNQQQELIQRQEQLKQAHDHLVQNSKTILAAQENFESKQASMFLALEKLFILHNAILLESRLIKAFLNIEQQMDYQHWLRLIFVLLASCQLLYAIYTYRDYESLNHQMLQSLIEKVNGMQGNKQLLYDDGESDVDWSSWIDADITEDELEDLDYMLPEAIWYVLKKDAKIDLQYNWKTIARAYENLPIENFESKQASMFLALEKLFILHNAILLESRLIKAFLVYCILIFTLYMFTSTKQTYSVRSRVYIGLCVTFLIELLVLRYGKDIEQQAWIISIGRLIFVLLASCQLLYAIYTYRDYESLNHQMLQSLIEKVNGMQGNKQLLYDDGESDVDWSSWIDADITEDELEDLDYMLPEAVKEGSATSSGSREYSLRNRRRR
ncbi:protein gamete expressed 1 isoform X1 [Tanacetum coccineum]